jgi:hypothetical protein
MPMGQQDQEAHRPPAYSEFLLKTLFFNRLKRERIRRTEALAHGDKFLRPQDLSPCKTTIFHYSLNSASLKLASCANTGKGAAETDQVAWVKAPRLMTVAPEWLKLKAIVNEK